MKHAHSRPSSWTATTVQAVTVLAIVLMAAGSLLLAFERPAAAASPTYSGAATIADGSTDATELSGGSASLFTFNLPAQAACPGDTTTGGYLVDSYLVPKATAVSSLTFSGGIPSVGFALYNSANNKAWVAQNTNTGTGQISGIPNAFEFGSASQVGHSRPALTSLLATPGVWEAGVACDLNGALTDYWNTEVTFSASTSDPGGFTWTQVPGNQSGSTSTTTTTGGSGTTTTTSDPSATTTTTTSASATTTTTVSSTTTMVAGVSSAATGGTGTGSSGTGSTFSSGSTGTGSSTTGSSGTLAFTGFPVGKGIGLGLLAVGIGLVLLAWEPRVRARLTTTHRGGPL